MIILTISGNKKEIRWMIKSINRDPRYEVVNISDFHTNRKNSMYHHVTIKLNQKNKNYQPRARPN